MNSSNCIWCLLPALGGHEEHIIPEVLGCPDGFILPGTVVCKGCNNGLAHLDTAVADEFDFLTFMAGIPRKKGKPPIISSRGNVHATVESTGPVYTFNMGSHAEVAHDGKTVSPFRGTERHIRATFQKDGPWGRVSFPVPFGQGKKFVHGLHKIALSSLTYFLGPDVARSEQFNAVRQFVRFNEGVRHVMVKDTNEKGYVNQAWAPYKSSSGDYVCIFRIAMIEFIVDLSESQSSLAMLEANAHELYGEGGWCVLPLRR